MLPQLPSVAVSGLPGLFVRRQLVSPRLLST